LPVQQTGTLRNFCSSPSDLNGVRDAGAAPVTMNWTFLLLVACCLGASSAASIGKRSLRDDGGADSGDSGGGDRKKRSSRIHGLHAKQVSTNCRTVVASNVNDPVACSKITMADLLVFDAVATPGWGARVREDDHGGWQEYADEENPDLLNHHDKIDLRKMPGRCRYDPFRHMIDPSSACLCVATRETCEYGRDGCVWYHDKKTGYRECISKAEKFYNMLYALLKKRGKKSFAIKIRYGATGARGQLPYGPYGPAIVGMGNPVPSKIYGVYPKKSGGGHGGGYGNTYGNTYGNHDKYSHGGAHYGGGGNTHYGGGGNAHYGGGGSAHYGGGGNAHYGGGGKAQYGGGGNAHYGGGGNAQYGSGWSPRKPSNNYGNSGYKSY